METLINLLSKFIIDGDILPLSQFLDKINETNLDENDIVSFSVFVIQLALRDYINDNQLFVLLYIMNDVNLSENSIYTLLQELEIFADDYRFSLSYELAKHMISVSLASHNWNVIKTQVNKKRTKFNLNDDNPLNDINKSIKYINSFVDNIFITQLNGNKTSKETITEIHNRLYSLIKWFGKDILSFFHINCLSISEYDRLSVTAKINYYIKCISNIRNGLQIILRSYLNYKQNMSNSKKYYNMFLIIIKKLTMR